MNANLGVSDRLVRAGIGILIIIGVLISSPQIFTSPVLYYGMLVIGGVSLINSVTGFCLIFRAFGVNSCNRPKQKTMP